MALRVDYLVRETGQNLARNPLPTIAAVTTVTVALTMLAASFLGRIGISNAFEEFDNDVTFVVYVNSNASADQVSTLRFSLEKSPQVDEVQYLDDKDTYVYAKKLFADTPEVLDGIAEGDLPTSFRVKPKNPDANTVRGVAQSFESKPGVKKVTFVADTVRKVQGIGDRLQYFLLVGSVVLAFSSVLLIFNTIQTAIFGRRREIEVMRLVGASNWYIRVPFVFEGFIQGMVGSALSCLAAWWFSSSWNRSLSHNLKDKTLFDKMQWTDGQFVRVILIVSLVGTLVSALVALLSTTWYLRD